MKKVTPMEKLQPEKKPSHQETMDDFVQIESQMLNKLFDFVSTNQLSPITHWNEINIGKPVKGMTEDECLLAFGKPQTISESMVKCNGCIPALSIFFQKRVRGNDYKIKKRSNPEIASRVLSSFY